MGNTKCVICGEPFTEKNVFTEAGWREIRISGFCEVCFDRATLEVEEDNEPEKEATD